MPPGMHLKHGSMSMDDGRGIQEGGPVLVVVDDSVLTPKQATAAAAAAAVAATGMRLLQL